MMKGILGLFIYRMIISYHVRERNDSPVGSKQYIHHDTVAKDFYSVAFGEKCKR